MPALIRAPQLPRLRHDAGAMDTTTHDELVLLPGKGVVLFLVRVERQQSVIAVAAAAFLDGLRAADALLSFSGLQREDLPLDELLPWAGSV